MYDEPWLKVQGEPVADSDDHLIELIQTAPGGADPNIAGTLRALDSTYSSHRAIGSTPSPGFQAGHPSRSAATTSTSAGSNS